MFSRIIDVDHFSEVIIPAVREEEKRELEHRLGILNVFNPIRVSSNIERDFQNIVVRKMVKCCISYATRIGERSLGPPLSVFERGGFSPYHGLHQGATLLAVVTEIYDIEGSVNSYYSSPHSLPVPSYYTVARPFGGGIDHMFSLLSLCPWHCVYMHLVVIPFMKSMLILRFQFYTCSYNKRF